MAFQVMLVLTVRSTLMTAVVSLVTTMLPVLMMLLTIGVFVRLDLRTKIAR